VFKPEAEHDAAAVVAYEQSRGERVVLEPELVAKAIAELEDEIATEGSVAANVIKAFKSKTEYGKPEARRGSFQLWFTKTLGYIGESPYWLGGDSALLAFNKAFRQKQLRGFPDALYWSLAYYYAVLEYFEERSNGPSDQSLAAVLKFMARHRQSRKRRLGDALNDLLNIDSDEDNNAEAVNNAAT